MLLPLLCRPVIQSWQAPAVQGAPAKCASPSNSRPISTAIKELAMCQHHSSATASASSCGIVALGGFLTECRHNEHDRPDKLVQAPQTAEQDESCRPRAASNVRPSTRTYHHTPYSPVISRNHWLDCRTLTQPLLGLEAAGVNIHGRPSMRLDRVTWSPRTQYRVLPRKTHPGKAKTVTSTPRTSQVSSLDSVHNLGGPVRSIGH